MFYAMKLNLKRHKKPWEEKPQLNAYVTHRWHRSARVFVQFGQRIN